ncbi:MAG: hypothetical protein GTO51_10070 [Candidatus Latescibacteria bacterium]|nr:hypothetical protein [Candidatus Latescibacterota bacterium]NIM66314.1 hypothetical protein [Candidatus Latescibacterota bacterium]NIO02793.1 hypothetical protein [Candidatus Latescibacterota bacterium]NIO29928.1 hypothetical protein [Candidatus Latescibacterota bacterium]NIO57543.1 hypothetical protein [Candidatus Latescibacterota bacterium]
MGKKIVSGLALCAFLILTPLLAFAKAPLAVMLSCRGDVVVIKGGEGSIKGSFGLALEAGDKIKTGEASHAEILFDNGNWIEVGPSSSMQLKDSKIKESSSTGMGGKSFQTVQNFLKLKDAKGTSFLADLRSDQKSPQLRPTSPCQTKIRGDKPTFRWAAFDPSAALRLTLYNEEDIHWQHDIKGVASLSYPDDAPPLVSGVAYSWALETTDPRIFPPLRSQVVFFEVLPSEENAKVETILVEIEKHKKPSASAYHLLRASLFFGHGLMEAAIDETLKALEYDARNPALHSILARLYAEVGRTEEALGEYDRLLEER